VSERTVDMNADVGEGGDDAALLEVVSSANVACGAHAGDELIMAGTVSHAQLMGVVLGAHPGYPDRPRFGRVELPLSPEGIEATVREQIAALGEIARTLSEELRHVKPHGALYHTAMRRREVAQAVARGAAHWSRDLVLVGQAGAPALSWWREMGFAVAAEGFADRRYEPDGTLRSRALEGALVLDPAEAAEQALWLADTVQTICVHSDTPGAGAIARAVRARLESAGIRVRPVRGHDDPTMPPS
jgi:UPF0271 protein